MKTKEDKLKLLEETATFYTSENRCLVGGLCKYWTEDKPNGCAIGRLISDKKLCKELNPLGTVGRDCVFDILPDELKDYGQNFLRELQMLHDTGDNWNETGLSERGKSVREEIKEQIALGQI